MTSSNERKVFNWVDGVAHGLDARFNTKNSSDGTPANTNDSTRTTVGKRPRHFATESDRERRRNKYFTRRPKKDHIPS
jgi:hypothetical protein